MQINRKTFGTCSLVRLFVAGCCSRVALGSSSENIRTSDSLRKLLNRFEWTKTRLLKIPAEFRIPAFPAEVTKHSDNEIISDIFSRDKKDGSHRMILNLKKLNLYATKAHFKMDTLHTITKLI